MQSLLSSISNPGRATNSHTTGGYDDWRLPNAKELQSIVDYIRTPATCNSAAIDPVFSASAITDGDGGTNHGFYWTGITHARDVVGGRDAVYVAFGEALGWMQNRQTGEPTLLDVHGAGAQRFDPKTYRVPGLRALRTCVTAEPLLPEPSGRVLAK